MMDANKRGSFMRQEKSHLFGYLLAVIIGAIGGGIVVAIATWAIPKIMSGMMHQMRECMQGCNCECASEMRQKTTCD
jgi:hypothetical protein